VSYSYLGTIRTQPGRRDEVARSLADGAAALTELGCLIYLVNRDVEDPDSVVVFEVWTSKQAHDDSLQVPAVRAAIAATMPSLTGEFSGRELEPVGGLGL